MVNKLKYGQIIFINNEKYTVIGMIEFKEDTWIWQEYKIKNESSDIKWLSAEEEEGKVQYSLYIEKPLIRIQESLEFNYENEKYSLFEQGTATVKSFYGNVDVDMYEKVNFKEYINDGKNKLISIENWSGEVEKSVGYYLKNEEVNITEEINNTLPKNTKGGAIAVVITLLSSIFFIFMIILGSCAISSSTISNFLNKSSDFEYVTSVTNNENNKKAKVYKTNLSIEQAVKKIIDAAPETIKEVKDDDESEGVGLLTRSEYAYVYKSEDGSTYVQVSKKSFMTENTNAYHSRYRNRGYYRTYTRNSTISTYSSYLNSARQQSINSRKSSGGGTSSGK